MGSLTTGADGFDERVVAEIPHLRSFLRGLAGDDADDLLQDVMERALRYRHGFDQRRGTLRAWLAKTAFRAFVDRRARERRAPRGLGDGVDDVPDEAPGRRVGVLEIEELDAILARLSPRERAVLVRFHGTGDSLAAIAEELGLPIGTVKSHLHRARRKLAGARPLDADETRGPRHG